MAAKPVDYDHSALVKLANHASKLLQDFLALDTAERYKMVELLAELEHVISEFRRLRPPPTFRNDMTLHLVRRCAICEESIDESEGQHFETPGAVYHSDCYRRATGLPTKR